MSVATESSSVISLADWDREWAHADTVYELCRGVPVMAPSERFPNLRAAMRLGALVNTMDGLEAVPSIEVLIADGPRPTVRRPDVVIVAANPAETRYRLPADEVLAVVEVVSHSTVRVDRTEKVTEYATAGIGTYLLVDVRDPENPGLTLFTDPADNAYRHQEQGHHVVLPVGPGVPVDAHPLT